MENPEVTLVCDLNEENLEAGLHVSDDVLAQVKEIVEPYLPGTDKAQVTYLPAASRVQRR